MGRNWKDSEGREKLKCREEPVSRNMDFEVAAGESMKGSQTYDTGNWKKGGSGSVAAECLATLSPTVTWKVQRVPNVLNDLAKRVLARVLKMPLGLLFLAKGERGNRS